MKNLDILKERYNSPAIPLLTAMRDFVNPSINERQVNRRANSGDLPFPAYKSDNNKSCWFVNIKALAKYLDNKEIEALKDYS